MEGKWKNSIVGLIGGVGDGCALYVGLVHIYLYSATYLTLHLHGHVMLWCGVVACRVHTCTRGIYEERGEGSPTQRRVT